MIKKFDFILDQFSKWGVILCIFFMLTLSLVSITLRQFEITFLWIEPLVRHLVFVATFFGGAIATGKSEHIKIDILARILEKSENQHLRVWLQRLILSATLVAVGILVKSSIDLMHLEFEDSRLAFFNIPTGYLLGIIPFGMGLIFLRIVVKIALTFTQKVS